MLKHFAPKIANTKSEMCLAPLVSREIRMMTTREYY